MEDHDPRLWLVTTVPALTINDMVEMEDWGPWQAGALTVWANSEQRAIDLALPHIDGDPERLFIWELQHPSVYTAGGRLVVEGSR